MFVRVSREEAGCYGVCVCVGEYLDICVGVEGKPTVLLRLVTSPSQNLQPYEKQTNRSAVWACAFGQPRPGFSVLIQHRRRKLDYFLTRWQQSEASVASLEFC